MKSTSQNKKNTLEKLLTEMGDVGHWLAHMNACEGTSGNISICTSSDLDPAPFFTNTELIQLPFHVPDLVGKSFLVTGSGTRLRDLKKDPLGNIGFLSIQPDGKTGLLFTHEQRRFNNLTSEFNSHLSLHQREIVNNQQDFNAVVHAQPIHLTYLSSIPDYQESIRFSRAIFRWQPEMILTFPFGLAFLPFEVPNSENLKQATQNIPTDYKLIIWAKHGVLAVSNHSVNEALDLIEYAETGARYEYLNLVNQNKAEGLITEDIEQICNHFQVGKWL